MHPVMKRLFIISTFLLLSFTGTSAQESGSFIGRMWKKVTSPNKHFEPEYIFQAPLRFQVIPEYKLSDNTVTLNSDLSTRVGDETSDASLHLNLKGHPFHSIGGKVAYGPLSLGASVQFGPHDKQNKSNFIKLYSSAYGIQYRRTKVNQYITGSLDLSQIGGADFPDIVSEYPGTVDYTVVDAYYVFNRNRFSYVAAYDGGKLIQKKSVGSPILVGRYLKGKTTIDPRDEVILNLLAYTGKYGNTQLSFGAGYSYNIVFFHRDPSEGYHGLQNLSMSLTAAPMLSIINNIITTRYQYSPGSSEPEGERHSKVQGQMQPNFVTRAGLFFAKDRFYFNVYSDFAIVHFDSGSRKMSFDESSIGNDYAITSKGNFSNWFLGINAGFRF